jgi:hypothetical protein
MRGSNTTTPRQNAYIQAYTTPSSPSFGNSYRSALVAGYSDQTARNLTHLQPEWLSANIGQIVQPIQPDELMTVLTDVIHDDMEPTIIRLKAVELTMRAYNMLAQRQERAPVAVELSVNLSGG